MLTSVHPPFDVRIFHKQARSLYRHGYQVVLIAPHSKQEVIDGIKIIPLPIPKNRYQRMTKTVLGLFKLALKENADVYHFHDPELIPIGLLLKACTRARVLYDVHEDYPKAIMEKHWLYPWTRRYIALLFKWVEKFSSVFFDGIISATPFIAKKFIYSKNIFVVRNLPIIDELSKEEPLPWLKRSNSVAYIGKISFLRGIKEMIEAIELASEKTEVRLILAGDFTPESLRKEIKLLSGWRLVEYKGYLSLQEVGELVGHVKAGLVLIHPEPRYLVSYPTKLFEYMSCGIPVIASDFQIWRELVESIGCGLLVNPLDTKGIADAIEYLIKNPKIAEEMGARGKEAVFTRYNWNSEEKKLFSLYQDILFN
ncbi:MAG: glycosyltransferase family 4 protein [Candidatus Atribacteria bacterium]|nr:glycosyltransferase family 4 protein [Candidatus Atribacteria bacterium]